MADTTIMFVGGLGGWEMLILFFFILLPIGVWIAALVDIIRSRFRNDTDRLLWVVVITVAPILGAIVYFILGRRYKLD